MIRNSSKKGTGSLHLRNSKARRCLPKRRVPRQASQMPLSGYIIYKVTRWHLLGQKLSRGRCLETAHTKWSKLCQAAVAQNRKLSRHPGAGQWQEQRLSTLLASAVQARGLRESCVRPCLQSWGQKGHEGLAYYL